MLYFSKKGENRSSIFLLLTALCPILTQASWRKCRGKRETNAEFFKEEGNHFKK